MAKAAEILGSDGAIQDNKVRRTFYDEKVPGIPFSTGPSFFPGSVPSLIFKGTIGMSRGDLWGFLFPGRFLHEIIEIRMLPELFRVQSKYYNPGLLHGPFFFLFFSAIVVYNKSKEGNGRN